MVWLLLLLLGFTNLAVAESRVALVIGNAAYKNESPLSNTLHDARDVAGVLERAGFEVIAVENGSRRDMNETIGRFLRRLRATQSVGLVYYSGHGLQVRGKNYLVPVDARIRSEWDVANEGVSVERLLAEMDGRGDGVTNLVILDACRNNPYQSDKGIGDKGLARVTAPSSTLILYATRPGKTADDNPRERNGLFTKHLLSAMERKGAEVEEAFREVIRKVYRESGREQYPWKEGALLERFYFFPSESTDSPPKPPPVAVPGSGVEIEVWRAAKECGTAACIQAYLDAYPEGRFAVFAREQLRHSGGESASPEPPEEPKVAPLKALLETCELHVRADRLTTGVGGNALECYQSVLEKDPGNRTALAGLDGIVERYLGWAESNLERGRLDRVTTYLSRAKQVNPEHPKLTVLEDRLAELTSPAPPTPSQAQVRTPENHPEFGPEMVRVSGGCFQMGSPRSEEGRDDDERQHRVCVDDFEIGKYEVTQAQWRAVMGNNPSHFSGCDECPVERVSWNDVQEYIGKLNNQTGKRYRLPTEAEWEYACRSGDRRER